MRRATTVAPTPARRKRSVGFGWAAAMVVLLGVVGTIGMVATTTPVAASELDAAPIITSAPGTTFSESQPGTFTVTTTGYPIPPLTETGALPTGVSFTDNGDGTATLSGTPAVGTNGVYSLTITATNGIPPDASQSFTLTVDAAPIITSASGTTFSESQPGTFTVTTTGYPTPALSETGTLPERGLLHRQR